MLIINDKLKHGSLEMDNFEIIDNEEHFTLTDSRGVSCHRVKVGYISEMIKIHRDKYNSTIIY